MGEGVMKVSADTFYNACGCRSAGECDHNTFSEIKALEALIDHFAEAVKDKLRKKYLQGYKGWDDENWTTERLREDMADHLYKGDPVDIGAFAAFLWNRMPGRLFERVKESSP